MPTTEFKLKQIKYHTLIQRQNRRSDREATSEQNLIKRAQIS